MGSKDIGEAWRLNRDTLVPLGSIALIGGGIWWASAFYGTVQRMAEDIREMKTAQQDYVTHAQMEARFLVHNLKHHPEDDPAQ